MEELGYHNLGKFAKETSHRADYTINVRFLLSIKK
jgi:hypothetical protein